MKNEYEYNEIMSRFYDVVYKEFPDKTSLNFYLDRILNAKGPVLEIGAGTGRIFCPALEKGADIYGIDHSVLMLNKLKEKISENDYSRISSQDVRNFKIDKKFRLIIAPFRIFQHLLNVNDQLEALHRIYEHLDNDGMFIFDVFVPALEKIIQDVDDIPEFDGEYEPGRKLRRLISQKTDYAKQLLNITFKFEWDENGEQRKGEYFTPLRFYFRFELEHLIARANFKIEKLFGDFRGKDITESQRDFIVVCKKQD